MRKDDPKRGTNDRTQEQERYDRTLKTVIINEENEPKHSGFLTKKESMEARDSSIFFLSIKKQKQNHSTPNPQFYVQKKHPLGMRWRQACSWVRGTNRRGSAASRTNQRGCPRGFCKREGKKHVDLGRQRQGHFYEFEVSLVTKLVWDQWWLHRPDLRIKTNKKGKWVNKGGAKAHTGNSSMCKTEAGGLLWVPRKPELLICNVF